MKENTQQIRKITWHALETKRVFEKLDSDWKGLSATEAEHRQNVFGPNSLPVTEQPSVFKVFLHQLKNPLIYILGSAE